MGKNTRSLAPSAAAVFLSRMTNRPSEFKLERCSLGTTANLGLRSKRVLNLPNRLLKI
jgi:hypothetical protein